MSPMIRNAGIGGAISPCSLLLKNGKILSFSSDPLEGLSEGEALDATGLIVTPGWIDLQLNGGFGHDFTQEPASIWEVASRLPELGLTAFLPTIISCPVEKLTSAIEVFRKGPPPGWRGATPLGLHLEGPFLNPARKGAHNPDYLRLPDLEFGRNWAPWNGVLLVTLAPELPGAPQLIRQLRENGVVVSAGHTTASYDQARAAFAAGVTCGTHLFNAQPPVGHREPGLAGAVLDAPEIYTGLIADGVHVHPAMVHVAWTCKRERLILVSDAVSALGMPPGTYGVGDFEVIVDEASVRLSDGTQAGSNAAPERCIANLAAWTGCSIAEAAGAMSTSPARLLGLADKGRIVRGADADLTLVTPEGRVAATIVGGEVLFKDPALLSVV
jgi:N-acetylglucosamine-6-phosphate deacetylase